MEEVEAVVPWNFRGGSVGDLGKKGLEAAVRSKAAREQNLLAPGLLLEEKQVHEEDSEDQVWSARKTKLD